MANGRVWVAVVAFAGAVSSTRAAPPSYEKDVKPFLAKYCLECHSGKKAKSSYSVETFADLTKKGRKGPLLNMDEPDRGRLIMSLEGRGRRMPPAKSPQPKDEEIAALRQWIKAGPS